MQAGGDGFLHIADVRAADMNVAVRSDAHADARGAGEDAEIEGAIGDVAGDGVREIGIVNGIRGVGAEILDFVASPTEVGDDGVFHFKSAMIGADSDAEWGLAHNAGTCGD